MWAVVGLFCVFGCPIGRLVFGFCRAAGRLVGRPFFSLFFCVRVAWSDRRLVARLLSGGWLLGWASVLVCSFVFALSVFFFSSLCFAFCFLGARRRPFFPRFFLFIKQQLKTDYLQELSVV